jgi:polyhydroxyalkanoate synthesis regulator phasin
MRTYNITDISYAEGQERAFLISNFTSISASIKSLISEIRTNRASIASLTEEIEELKTRVTALEP